MLHFISFALPSMLVILDVHNPRSLPLWHIVFFYIYYKSDDFPV